jgi:hypothetical protein
VGHYRAQGEHKATSFTLSLRDAYHENRDNAAKHSEDEQNNRGGLVERICGRMYNRVSQAFAQTVSCGDATLS